MFLTVNNLNHLLYVIDRPSSTLYYSKRSKYFPLLNCEAKINILTQCKDNFFTINLWFPEKYGILFANSALLLVASIPFFNLKNWFCFFPVFRSNLSLDGSRRLQEAAEPFAGRPFSNSTPPSKWRSRKHPILTTVKPGKIP